MDLPMPRFLAAALIALALALPAAAPASAQSFAPRIRVDEAVITGYEIEQRQRFLTILGVQGDVAREAENTLIDDRVRVAEARRVGLRVTPEQIRAGMEEFASRAELSADELIDIFAQNGIAEATFRDFVEAGVVWRELVRVRFVPRLQAVSEADIDRALLLEAQRGPTVRVQFSEIVLPAGRNAEAVRLSRSLRGAAAFEAAAREMSLGATAAEGGRVDWTPVAWLPPQVAAALGSVQTGQVTPPVAVANGVAIYLLRGTQTLPSVTPRVTTVEYATVAIPGAGTPQAAAEVARLRAGADRCGDLWGLTQGGADRVRIERRLMSDTPAAIAAELGRLDVGEASARLTSGGAVLFLMLCERRIESGRAPAREAIRERIILERLEGSARIWLAELRARADIRR